MPHVSAGAGTHALLGRCAWSMVGRLVATRRPVPEFSLSSRAYMRISELGVARTQSLASRAPPLVMNGGVMLLRKKKCASEKTAPFCTLHAPPRPARPRGPRPARRPRAPRATRKKSGRAQPQGRPEEPRGARLNKMLLNSNIYCRTWPWYSRASTASTKSASEQPAAALTPCAGRRE